MSLYSSNASDAEKLKALKKTCFNCDEFLDKQKSLKSVKKYSIEQAKKELDDTQNNINQILESFDLLTKEFEEKMEKIKENSKNPKIKFLNFTFFNTIFL